MSEAKTRKAVPTRDFTDAGTGESYTAGQEVTLEAGAFTNYEAAGLVTKPGAAERTDKPAA